MKKLTVILLTIIICITSISCQTSTSQKDDDDYEVGFVGNKSTKEIESSKEVVQRVYKTVKFNTNGGEYIQYKSIEKGSQLNTAPTPTKVDHVFEGWFIDQTLTQAAVFPITIEKDITLYAKWLKVKGTQGLVDTKIKWSSNYEDCQIYNVTPNGFNLQRLAELGYKINIEIKYDVHYQKDYDVPLNIGYAGAPKYEVYLINSQNYGQIKEDVKASSTTVTNTISDSYGAAQLMNDIISFKISTNNVQNIIHFTNMSVTYTCYK